MKLAVLGDPLTFTLSPVLHEAGLAALGRTCRSLALPTPPRALAARLAALEADGYRGVNLTIPLKEAVLPLLARVAPDAARARSVNTLGFGPDGRWGESTDGPGFLDFLGAEGIAPQSQHVLLIGAGGAARSVAGALAGAGARSVALATRDPARHASACAALGLDPPLGFDAPAMAAAFARATLVIQATPAREPAGVLDPSRVPPGAVAVDMGYGGEPTPWVGALHARGVRALDGVGMLIHQARRSIALWTGEAPPLAALEAAVARSR